MDLIVADAYGYGARVDRHHNSHELSPDDWTEIDIRDRIVAGIGVVVIRYRKDGRQVDVAARTTYDIEYHGDDLENLHVELNTVDELVAAMQGTSTDEQRVLDLIGAISFLYGTTDGLKRVFHDRTGHTLEESLRDELGGAALDQALAYLA